MRQKAWPFILGVLPWDADEREREGVWSQLKIRYRDLKAEWYGVDEVFNRPDILDVCLLAFSSPTSQLYIGTT